MTVAVTQEWSLEVQSSTQSIEATVAAVQDACRVASPDCVVSVPSARARRQLRGAAATDLHQQAALPSAIRSLQEAVALRIRRSLQEGATLADEVPVAAGVVVLATSLDAVDAASEAGEECPSGVPPNLAAPGDVSSE